jgi:mannose-6-phosphate isomerase-like protein (cupin superfamily)
MVKGDGQLITQDMLSSLIEHKKASEIVVLKGFCTEVPSWQEFIDYIDESSRVTDSKMPDEPNEYDLSLGATIKGNVMVKQSFYFYLVQHKQMGKTEEIADALINILNAPGGLSSFYVNFSSNINNISSHKDALDNFYWQCIGSTEWMCQDKVYSVSPGDMVYIPANSYHAVNFSMPRAAIGFACDLSKSPLFNQ